MGDPKKSKRKYSRPKKPWDKTRLEEERTLKENYGLKNKKELWMTEKQLKNKRQNARKLLALELERRIQREKELLESLKTIGILKGNATLDEVLGLKIEEFLERRLQTIVWRKGLANTPKQARQFIVHGHIAVNGKKAKTPSYIVKSDEEGKIAYYKKPLKLRTEKPKQPFSKKVEQKSASGEKAKEKTEEHPAEKVEKPAKEKVKEEKTGKKEIIKEKNKEEIKKEFKEIKEKIAEKMESKKEVKEEVKKEKPAEKNEEKKKETKEEPKKDEGKEGKAKAGEKE